MKGCWNLTNLCNEECYFCFRELQERARAVEDNIVILNKLKNIGFTEITYAGGEPLIYSGLRVLLKYARSLGIKNNLITKPFFSLNNAFFIFNISSSNSIH